MKQEQVKDFTRRISQCNRAGSVVVIYDILFAYLADAREAYAAGEYEAFKAAVGKAARAVDELAGTLDFKYEIAKNLYSLYVFVKEALAKTVVKKRLEDLDEAERVLRGLYEGFAEAARQDHSKPLMQNAQQVYAGMTYGRHDLTETFQESASRGFLA